MFSQPHMTTEIKLFPLLKGISNIQTSAVTGNYTLIAKNNNLPLQECGVWRHLVVVRVRARTNSSFLLITFVYLCNENEYFNLVYNKLCRYLEVFHLLMLPACGMHLSEPSNSHKANKAV